MERIGGAGKRAWVFFLKHKWPIAIAVCALGGGYYFWKSDHAGTAPVQYVTASPEKGMISASVSGSGNVIVDSQANIDPTITGTVANLSVSAGDSVKKGQLLFMIVNDELDVRLAKAAASLKQAENSVAAANISKDQARDAYNSRSGTALNKNVLKQKLDMSREAIVAAEKSLSAAQAEYRNTVADAARRRVLSPIDGTVNGINIKNGDDLSTISSGSSKVTPMIIGDLSTMKASVSVNEVDIANVSIGQKATVKFSALGGISLAGKVEKVDSLGSITQGVVTYSVTIGFDAPDDRIKPGMSVSASIIYDVRQGVLTVPNSAVKSDANGSYVQILRAGVPERRSVEPGISNSVRTEISEGLSEEDAVVTKTIDPSAKTPSAGSSGSGIRIPGIGGRG